MQSKYSHTAKKRLSLAVALAVPLFFISSASEDYHYGHCSTSATAKTQINSNCLVKSAANNSWLHWFSGQSRSIQFQFIDLFELVHTAEEESAKKVLPTREG
jgi:hypothetical protein